MHTTRLRAALAATAAASALFLTASCSSGATGTATDSAASASNATGGVVDASTGAELVQAQDRTVIDVRTPAEYAAGHVAGAENIDVTAPDFSQKVDGLDRDGKYVLYCHSGNRAAAAAQAMEQMGFKNVVNAGGFDALAAAGAPTS